MVTQDVQQAFGMVVAVSEAIREMGEVPSGHLFAILNARGVGIENYNRIINILITTGLVKRLPSHLLMWVGPAIEKETEGGGMGKGNG